MQGKIIFVLGAAVGYVVGTRKGRRGYEQLKSQAADAWQSPRVQQTVSGVENFAKEKLPVVGEQVGQLAKKAAESVSAAARKTSEEPESVAIERADAIDGTEKDTHTDSDGAPQNGDNA
jgi:hypothetical protein